MTSAPPSSSLTAPMPKRPAKWNASDRNPIDALPKFIYAPEEFSPVDWTVRDDDHRFGRRRLQAFGLGCRRRGLSQKHAATGSGGKDDCEHEWTCISSRFCFHASVVTQT